MTITIFFCTVCYININIYTYTSVDIYGKKPFYAPAVFVFLLLVSVSRFGGSLSTCPFSIILVVTLNPFVPSSEIRTHPTVPTPRPFLMSSLGKACASPSAPKHVPNNQVVVFIPQQGKGLLPVVKWCCERLFMEKCVDTEEALLFGSTTPACSGVRRVNR